MVLFYCDMNIAYLLLLFWVFAPKQSGCETIGVEKDNALLQELISQYFYPDLIRTVKHSYEYELHHDSQRDFKDGFLTNQYPQNKTCSQKLSQFWNSSDNEKRAAYFDSFGKIGAGILTGNIINLGYYDQCIDIGNTDFCRFPFNVALTTTNKTILFNAPIQFGMCFPSSCSASDFYHLFFDSDGVAYNRSFANYTITISIPTIQNEPLCSWRDLEWTTSSIIVQIICVLLVVFVLTGTIVDLLFWIISVLSKTHLSEMKKMKESTTTINSTSCEVKKSIDEDNPHYNARVEFLKDLILSFSLYKTIPVIVATRQPANAITSINGIRVFSMFWVIFGHTYAWALSNNAVENILEVIQTIPNRFFFQPVTNAYFAVDGFFVMSGLLMSYLSIREMERRQGKFPFIFFYLHRFLRLSPAYYLLIFVYFKILPYIGSGPLWFFTDIHYCEKYWWTNLLYINNFYPTNLAETCYSVTWYLANDMQFFIISPIFLLLLYHFWKLGFATITGTMLASIALIGTLAGIKNANANLALGLLTNTAKFAYSNIYEKPYSRINAYLVGILLGFVLHKKWRVQHHNYWIHICVYSILWIIAAVFCLTTVFGEYKTWHRHPFSKTENVMYFMFSRTTYSIGLAIMIYVCHNGFGGAINTFLSWKLWIPLSRLTFMAYLAHPIVLTVIYGTLRFRFIYTDIFLIILVVATIVLSYSLAFVLAAFVEYPLANVESAVYKFAGVQRRK